MQIRKRSISFNFSRNCMKPLEQQWTLSALGSALLSVFLMTCP